MTVTTDNGRTLTRVSSRAHAFSIQQLQASSRTNKLRSSGVNNLRLLSPSSEAGHIAGPSLLSLSLHIKPHVY